MIKTDDTHANRAKLAQLQSLLRQMLGDALVRGMYGSVAIEISVQDGTIQHIRQRTERIER